MDTPTTQYTGVSWHKPLKKWLAQVSQKNLGFYSDEKEAALVYDKKKREICKAQNKKCVVNFPAEGEFQAKKRKSPNKVYLSLEAGDDLPAVSGGGGEAQDSGKEKNPKKNEKLAKKLEKEKKSFEKRLAKEKAKAEKQAAKAAKAEKQAAAKAEKAKKEEIPKYAEGIPKIITDIAELAYDIRKKRCFGGVESHFQAIMEAELRDKDYWVQHEPCELFHYQKLNGEIMRLPNDIRQREDSVLPREKLILELKAAAALNGDMFCQIFRYMEERRKGAWGLQTTGMLINFGKTDVEVWYMYYKNERLQRIRVFKEAIPDFTVYIDTFIL